MQCLNSSCITWHLKSGGHFAWQSSEYFAWKSSEHSAYNPVDISPGNPVNIPPGNPVAISPGIQRDTLRRLLCGKLAADEEAA